MQADLDILCSGLSQPSFNVGDYRIVIKTTELCIFYTSMSQRKISLFFIEILNFFFIFCTKPYVVATH